MRPVLFTPAAEADVEEALAWYEAQRPGLGEAFRRALDVAVASIEDHPEAYAVIHRETRNVPIWTVLSRPRRQPSRSCVYARQAPSQNVAQSLRSTHRRMKITWSAVPLRALPLPLVSVLNTPQE